MITSSVLGPLADMIVNILPLLLGAMLSFIALVWSAKKLLFLLDTSDFINEIRIAKESKNFRQKDEIHDSFFKTKQTKKEREKRKRLYKINKINKFKDEVKRLRQANFQRAKFESIKEAYDMRINEKIKEAKKQALNEKINSKLDSRYFKSDDEGKSYIFTYAT